MQNNQILVFCCNTNMLKDLICTQIVCLQNEHSSCFLSKICYYLIINLHPTALDRETLIASKVYVKL
jgi:hypothetical protein